MRETRVGAPRPGLVPTDSASKSSSPSASTGDSDPGNCLHDCRRLNPTRSRPVNVPPSSPRGGLITFGENRRQKKSKILSRREVRGHFVDDPTQNPNLQASFCPEGGGVGAKNRWVTPDKASQSVTPPGHEMIGEGVGRTPPPVPKISGH